MIRKTGGYGNQAAMMDRLLDKMVQVTANLTQTVTILASVIGQPKSNVSPTQPKAVLLSPAGNLKLETFPPEIVEQVDSHQTNRMSIPPVCILPGYHA